MPHSYDPDHALITDVKHGHPKAVEIWYKKFSPVIQRYVSTKIDNVHDIDEIVRETFLNCLRHLPLFRGSSTVKTWMIRIASHEVADYYRKRYAKKFIHALPLTQLLFIEPTRDMHQTSQAVTQTMKQIREDYRQLLLLKYVDNTSVQDIAEQLGKSIKSVESDLFRARKEFKTLFAIAVGE